MQPSTNQDYKQLLTEVIKKQIVILGPDITLSKARNVKGLTVADDGTVTSVDEGHPQEVIQALIDQFVQLSGLIVKKTMEPLLSLSQPAPEIAQPTMPQPGVMPPIIPAPTQPSVALPTIPAPTAQPIMQPAETTATQEPAPAAVAPQPTTPTVAPTSPTPPPTPQANTNPTPATNPLAA